MLKRSKYNFIYKRNPDENIVYNTFSKAVISLNDAHLNALNLNNFDAFSNDELEQLTENGILIESSFDENDYLRYYNNKVRFCSEYFCLTIAPTLSCNFDCPYCFEDKRDGRMSEETQISLISFIEDKVKKGIKTLEVTWYGGEPLLCFDIIKNLCEKIFRMANDYGLKCKMGMISNGYLLNEEIVDFLEKYNISFQITLDGLADNHNRRRYLKNGEGTFDKIFKNLTLFKNKNIDVYVRMNVDEFNKADYPLLSDAIDSLKNDRMILYPAVTENINERKVERKKHYMADSSYDDFISLTRRNGLFKFKSTDLPISNDVGSVPDNRCYFCAAELDNSCVIDEKGNVYKCWNEVGHKDYCFNINNQTQINFDSLLRYMGDHTFSDEKCKDCVFLPLCFGGCKFHRYHLKRYACAFSEASMIAYLEDSLLN